MEKLNRWLALLTNLGVIAGLALLVYEINQNTQALKNDIDVAIYTMAADNYSHLIERQELRNVLEAAATKEWSQFSRTDRSILWGYWGNEVDRLE